jgi:hypothetical protein
MNKHFAILPCGTRVTRNSQTRTYSHLVAVRPDYNDALNSARGWGQGSVHKSNYLYAVERTEQGDSHRFGPMKTKDELRFPLIAAMSLEEYRASMSASAVARVEGLNTEGYYDLYQSIGWNGRLDLAQKLAAQQDTNRVTVVILEAQIA